jgi:hypothetical protein
VVLPLGRAARLATGRDSSKYDWPPCWRVIWTDLAPSLTRQAYYFGLSSALIVFASATRTVLALGSIRALTLTCSPSYPLSASGFSIRAFSGRIPEGPSCASGSNTGLQMS